MNEFCYNLLLNLARTSVFLAAAACLVALILRISRCQSPRVHRVAWCLVLFQGWLFVQLTWSIAYRASPTAALIESVDRTGFENRPLELDEFSADGGGMPLQVDEAVRDSIRISESRDYVGESLRDSQRAMDLALSYLPIVMAGAWVIGCLVMIGAWLQRYLRFLRRLPGGDVPMGQWAEEWTAAARGQSANAAVELRITDEFGPLLCRHRRGYRLLVPRPLWSVLSSAQRMAILRHELGHYRRGDLWKSIAIRFLALPHWFNPFAWLAVRRFDEAAEWACDQLATAADVPATEFANVLLKLCESTKYHGAMVPAARGSSVKRRIRRLLSLSSMEDSQMRKLIVCGLAGLLLVAGGLRVRLVAEEALQDPSAPKAESANAEAATSEVIEQEMAMVKAAKDTYNATQAAYQAETVSLEQLGAWSRRWLQALLDVAKTPADRIVAYRAYFDRMQQLHKEIALKFHMGAKGGEADRFYATEFYLAEAKMWVSREVTKLTLPNLNAPDRPRTQPPHSPPAAKGNPSASSANDARLEVYPITNADPDTVLKVLQTMLTPAGGDPSDLRLTIDPLSKWLIALARPNAHAKIRELLSKLDNPEPQTQLLRPLSNMERKVYNLQFASSAAVQRLLEPLVKSPINIELNPFVSNRTLIVSATPDTHAAIDALLQQVDRPAATATDAPAKEESPRKRIVSKFTNVDIATAQKMLPQLVPADSNYEVTYDFQEKSLIVKAPDTEHNAPAASPPAAPPAATEK